MTTIPLLASQRQTGGVANPPIPMESAISMVRVSTEPGGRDRFSCSVADWLRLQQVAESFGWKRRGTSYSSSQPAFVESPVRHDYEPGDSRDQKRVDGQDALGLAMALAEARRSPHLPAMLEGAAAEDPTAVAFTAVMDEFIAYAYRGAFSFAHVSENSN